MRGSPELLTNDLSENFLKALPPSLFAEIRTFTGSTRRSNPVHFSRDSRKLCNLLLFNNLG